MLYCAGLAMYGGAVVSLGQPMRLLLLESAAEAAVWAVPLPGRGGGGGGGGGGVWGGVGGGGGVWGSRGAAWWRPGGSWRSPAGPPRADPGVWYDVRAERPAPNPQRPPHAAEPPPEGRLCCRVRRSGAAPDGAGAGSHRLVG